MQNTNIQNPSFENFAKLYTVDAAEFVKTGKAVMSKIAKASDDVIEAKGEFKTLGLQFAVLGKEFFSKLMTTPAWFNKGVGDFIRHTYGMKEGERFPSTAWQNARVVLAIVVPDNGAPMLAEQHYLALSQSGLTLLAKIVLHEKVMPKSQLNRQHPELLEACKIAEGHADGYAKKLKAIVAKLDGKSEADKKDPVAQAIETIAQAIAKAGDGEPASAKALYFMVCRLSDSWQQSGVSENDLNAWTTEFIKSVEPESETSAETVEIPVTEMPALAAA